MLNYLKLTQKVYLSFLLISLFLIVSACNSSTSSNNPSEGEGNESDGSDLETFTLSFNSAFPNSGDNPEDPKTVATNKFAELIEERTDGRVKVDLYFSNQLAGQRESLDALASGTIDMQNITPAAWADIIPEGSLYTLPFWNMGEEHALHLLNNTDVGKLYEEALEEYGVIKLLDWAASTSGFMSKEPIYSVDDLNGKVAVSRNSFESLYFEALGVGSASIPIAEYYEGFSRGVMDVANMTYSMLDSYSLHEVVNYITVPTENPGLGIIAMSLSAWNKLPEDIQSIILEVAEEIEQETVEVSKATTKKTLQFAEDNNVEFVEMEQEDFEEFVRIAQETAWKAYAESNERTAKIIEVLNEENEKWQKEHNYSADSFLNEYR